MITLIPVKVVCHSGYKADEYPKSFFYNNQEFEVTEISDRWYQTENTSEFPAADYFRVKTGAGEKYLLKHELKDDRWFFCFSVAD